MCTTETAKTSVSKKTVRLEGKWLWLEEQLSQTFLVEQLSAHFGVCYIIVITAHLYFILDI